MELRAVIPTMTEQIELHLLVNEKCKETVIQTECPSVDWIPHIQKKRYQYNKHCWLHGPTLCIEFLMSKSCLCCLPLAVCSGTCTVRPPRGERRASTRAKPRPSMTMWVHRTPSPELWINWKSVWCQCTYTPTPPISRRIVGIPATCRVTRVRACELVTEWEC